MMRDASQDLVVIMVVLVQEVVKDCTLLRQQISAMIGIHTEVPIIGRIIVKMGLEIHSVKM
jgi:hypothetical protein